jgi:hypothetical protein
LANFSYFKNKSRLVRLPWCLCVCALARACVCMCIQPPPLPTTTTTTTFERLNRSLWNLVCISCHVRPSQKHTT